MSAYFLYQALLQELNKSKAEIELLEYEISQKMFWHHFQGLLPESIRNLANGWLRADRLLI
jgi:hypothetical protein